MSKAQKEFFTRIRENLFVPCHIFSFESDGNAALNLAKIDYKVKLFDVIEEFFYVAHILRSPPRPRLDASPECKSERVSNARLSMIALVERK